MATSPISNKQASGSKYGDLKRRIVFLLLALIVYRVGAHVPVPGIDPGMLAQLFSEQQGGILGLLVTHGDHPARRAYAHSALGLLQM